MSKRFKEYSELNLSQVNKDILHFWDEYAVFDESLEQRKDAEPFIFYEGPPSANGVPGIHHVISRTIKDIFCRYKTLQGYLVQRKAGWDTHGLPVELGVEKMLGITKEDIGTKVSVDEYNEACRKEVMKYTDLWEEVTRKMGYWVNMDEPYITYDNRYIETLWYLLKELYKKDFLYKGYTIQPYSPAAGTGLSTHELNQPGCYKDVKDTSCVGMFKMKVLEGYPVFEGLNGDDLYALAWTTTPWTLPSNTALAVGSKITYVKVHSFNPYTREEVKLLLAKDLLAKFFAPEGEELAMIFEEGQKLLPYRILGEYQGKDLLGLTYEQLIPWVNPGEGAFKIIEGDFVTTSDGTGIVHIAPTFGADDNRVAMQNDVPPLVLLDKKGLRQPMVDTSGRFFRLEDLDENFVNEQVNVAAYSEYAGRYVKNAFDESLTDKDPSLDVDLAVMLKKNSQVFKVEKYVHSYPHCWRTDKPVLYYPLDSWFIKTTAVRERMMELNKTINWKPESTGAGRFGKWLENLVDWNLSRSRYWGTPLPIWRTADGVEEKCIGSVEELISEIEKAVAAGKMDKNPYEDFVVGAYDKKNYEKIDLHRPYVDDIVLLSDRGEAMYREKDLIDVWFDSGAMPYAQVHYPFATTSLGDKNDRIFPADFIAEGVDQTRGWFFTLHALGVMLFDSVAFKNIISNGLVLDKAGNKMSKRLGNGIEPFEAIENHGSDPLRWYMVTNAQPWDNLKFDMAGVEEVKRKFFGTLYNTYSFFALYANVDGFTCQEEQIPLHKRPRIDRWILSLLNTLVRDVESYYNDYEPTRAGRAIQNFVIEHLSNWYVRLNRKRFWGGEYNEDKLSAFQTLYTCLEIVSKLSCPIAPFFMDQLYMNLKETTALGGLQSVHLTSYPKVDVSAIDESLEKEMLIAQRVSSLVLGLRRKVNIKVRQPLQRLMIPVLSNEFEEQFAAIKDLVLSEVNVKEVAFLKEDSDVLKKNIKPNFKTLGPKYGKDMKAIAATIQGFGQDEIASIERSGSIQIKLGEQLLQIERSDVEIGSEDIPGWEVVSDGMLTVALDVTISEELRMEGLARELINRVQNMRKEQGLEVTDKIEVRLCSTNQSELAKMLAAYERYISNQILANSIIFADKLSNGVEQILAEGLSTSIEIESI